MTECIDLVEDRYRECGLGRAAHRRRSNIIVLTVEGWTYILPTFEGTVIRSCYHAIRLRSDVNEWLNEKGDRTRQDGGGAVDLPTMKATRPVLRGGAFVLKRASERGLGRELPTEWFP